MNQQLINDNLDLLRIIAIQHRTHAWGVDDLSQEGYFGLVRAAEEYSKNQNVSFRTFASWWVHKYIRDFINNQQLSTDNTVPVDELDIIDDHEQTLLYHLQLDRLSQAVAELSERDQFIVNSLYGINGTKFSTTQLSQCMHVSVQYIRRLRAQTQQRLRAQLRKKG